MDAAVRPLLRTLDDSRVTGPQLLAAAVVQRALDDARDPRDPERQHAARMFLLADTAIFEFWATVLDVDPMALRALARHALAGALPVTRRYASRGA